MEKIFIVWGHLGHAHQVEQGYDIGWMDSAWLTWDEAAARAIEADDSEPYSFDVVEMPIGETWG